MNYASLLDLVYNAALLLAMVIIYDIAAGQGHASLSPVRQLFTGLALGAIGVVIMLTPWEFAPGIIFDTRSVLLSIAGLFFGAIPATVAILITGSLRYLQGGAAALTGIAVIVASGGLGVAWHYLRRRPLSELTVREFYLFGIAVHLTMLGLMLTLPWAVAREVLSSITFPVLLIYPIITVALGMLFTRRLQRDETAEALRESEFLFRSQFDLGNIGIAITHPDKHWLRVNPCLCEMLGYNEQELMQQSWVDITHPDDLEADLAQYQAMLEDKVQGYSMDKRFIRKNGELLYTHMTIACYRVDGKIQFFIAGIIDTTASQEAGAQLRAQKEQLAFVLAGSDLGYWDWNIQSNTIQSNERWAEILEAEPDGVTTDHQFWFDRIHPDDRRQVRHSLTDHLEGRTPQHKIEYRVLTKRGRYKWILDCAKVVSYSEDGNPLRMSGTQTDITQRKAAEASMQLASMVYQNSHEAMVVTNSHGQIIDTNPAFTAITGYQPADVQGKSPKILVSRHQDRNIFDNIVNALFSDGCWKGEIEQCRKNGTTYTAWLSINSIYNPDGSVQRRVAQFADITDKKKSDQIIWSQANFDALTGLPNRHMFLSQLEQEQRKAHHRGDKVALLFLDLDHFKEINDTLGHHIGDELLKAVAKRLQHCVKDTDTVSRLGGDEFTVILSGQTNTRGAEHVAQRILAEFAKPFSLDVEAIYISPSIGITLFPEDGTDADTLLKNADQAMYAAKAQGRNNYRYFTASMQEEALYRRRLGNELRQALGSDQLELHYQPIVDIHTGAITKAEALLRWNHPALGYIGPAEFIPVAEETGMIVELGDWVFRQAAQQVAIWRREFHPTFQVSINKSPLQFREQGNDIHSWIDQLRSLDLPGQAITIEITEGLLLDASRTVTDKLLAFRDAGIQVSLDDFGTGYSSLSYIKKFDVDNIKIDQSFVRNLSAESDDMAVCEAIIVMAHKLGLEVVAEGIENESQRALLATAGCDYGQGSLFSMPKPAEAFSQLLQARQTQGTGQQDVLA